MLHLNLTNHLIRPYTPSELLDVLEVWESSAREVYSFMPESFWPLERKLVESEYLPAAVTWVCEIDERVVGFASLIGAELGGLFVKPRFQNLGIGRALVGFVQRSHHALEVEVFQENQKAWRFYERQGFSLIWEREHPEWHRKLARLRWVRSA